MSTFPELERVAELDASRRVTVLTVSYNTADLTSLLLWSLHRVLDWPDLEILVVDNGSTDGSRELLSAVADAGFCSLVANEANLGHGAALNQGLALLRSSPSPCRVWILDSDCLIARPDALAVALADHPSADVVGEPHWDPWHGRERLELYSLLIDSFALSGSGVAAFTEDGDPAFEMLMSAERAGLDVASFPFTRDGYVIHRGRGSLAAVVAAEDRTHPLYAWAAEHHKPHFGGVHGAAERYQSLVGRFRREVEWPSHEGLIASLERC